MNRSYTAIVPRADWTAPTNVAVELANSAARRGWTTRLLFLSGRPARDDLSLFDEVRRFRVRDLWRTQGVVHTHGLRPDVVGALCKMFGRSTVIATLHGQMPGHLSFDYSPCKVRLGWWLWSSALRLVDYRVCISATMLRHYRRQFPGWAFALAYNSRGMPDVEERSARPDVAEWMSEQRSLGRHILSYVGWLSARKNVFALVQAVLDEPDVALAICGKGEVLEQIRTECEKRDLDRRIYIVGYVKDPEVYIAMSDVLVLPSFSEGLPLVTLEAASLGVPCLLSDIAVHRELAGLGLGLTFRRHDFKDFGPKARRLAESRSPSADGQRRAVWKQYFSPEIGFQQYERMLLNVVC